jgi:hypothetical protein
MLVCMEYCICPEKQKILYLLKSKSSVSSADSFVILQPYLGHVFLIRSVRYLQCMHAGYNEWLLSVSLHQARLLQLMLLLGGGSMRMLIFRFPGVSCWQYA